MSFMFRNREYLVAYRKDKYSSVEFVSFRVCSLIGAIVRAKEILGDVEILGCDRVD